ncbi:hypothetical protein PVAP13_6KG279606 [Panicum virgatum]|uniref:Uncharacterized protein n=1 Tax=Panicum virgatum TaxID=38727 RepID=A0A8T0RHB8_PANVG|nr:hypothetical protein PVAP13_6KG279606 [Panicum virgatum]
MVVPARTGGRSACPEEEGTSVRLLSRSGSCCGTCLRKRACRSHDVFFLLPVWSLLILLPLYEFKKGDTNNYYYQWIATCMSPPKLIHMV